MPGGCSPKNNTAGANAAVTITIPAPGPGRGTVLKMLACSYSAAPTNGKITVADGTGTIFEVDITAAGTYNAPIPEDGLTCAPASAVTITLAAGGAAVVGKVNTAHLVH